MPHTPLGEGPYYSITLNIHADGLSSTCVSDSTITFAIVSKSSSSHSRGSRTSHARDSIFAVLGSGSAAGAKPQLIKFRALDLWPNSSTGSPCAAHSSKNACVCSSVTLCARLNCRESCTCEGRRRRRRRRRRRIHSKEEETQVRGLVSVFCVCVSDAGCLVSVCVVAVPARQQWCVAPQVCPHTFVLYWVSFYTCGIIRLHPCAAAL